MDEVDVNKSRKRRIEPDDDPLAEKRAAYRKFFEEHKRQKEERKAKLIERTEQKKQEQEHAAVNEDANDVGDEKKGRLWTLSIAVPGSLLSKAKSPEMRTYIAGQIARAAAIFCVDEIVIYNDFVASEHVKNIKRAQETSKENVFHMAKILQYMECPQYLRKYFFPVHPDLKYVGLLNPLDAPHHLRKDEVCEYREGVTLQKEGINKRGKSFVNVGLQSNALVFDTLKPKERVTVKFRKPGTEGILHGDQVPYHTPRTESGIYWGYDVRLAASFNAVFCQSPYDDGYDLTVGVSPNGIPFHEVELSSFQHAIIIFSGRHSLEEILDKDEKLEVKNPIDLFDCYVNTCPNVHTSTMRTEESLLISLSVLKMKLCKALQL